ncbi:MAG TPA: hypothetical protein VHO69_01705, partial [Phototrophicaceae bacterium]|nr:hypothetical protein [Phototrophicaceae bacterium]
MNIGVMLRHYEQPGGGVKVYTQNLLKRLLALDQSNHYVLMYHNPQLIGTYAAYPHVEEIALAAPGKFLWDQVAVPWVAWKKHLDIIFNLKFTVPFVTQAKTAFVVHNAEWFVVPEAFLWYDRLYFQTIGPLYYRAADAIVSVSE